MHLFEASLAWVGRSDDPEWRTLADRIGRLALDRLIDGRSGLLREQFDADWAPAAGLAGRLVEPGHQFEWAWLLLRWGGPQPAVSSAAALRLIRLGEAYGLRDGVAINAVLDDGSAHDASARLWPQTEWLKATILAAERTGEPGWWRSAGSAAEALLRFLDTGLPGLWRDRLGPDGRFVEEPAPASSFYHIVAAIAELARVLAAR